MVGTIVPIGYGEHGSLRLLVRSLMAHAAGGLVGGMLTGSAIAALGHVLLGPATPEVRALLFLVAFGAVGVVYGLADTLGFRLPRPELRRQVPIVWQRRFSASSFSFLYGASLGSGITTYIRVSSLYLLLIWAFFSRSPMTGAVTLGVFGLARSLPVFRIAIKNSDTREGLEQRIDGLELGQGVGRFVNGLVMFTAVGAVAAALVSSQHQFEL